MKEELENRIIKGFGNVSHVSYELYDSLYGGTSDKEAYSLAVFWTHNYLNTLYYLICIYLESLGLNNYLEEFKSKYKNTINDPKKSTEFISFPLNDGDSEQELELVFEWKDILFPFGFIDRRKEDTDEYKKLLQLLGETNHIIKLTQSKISKEDDINYIMRQILGLYFNEVIAFSQGYFRHRFKEYRPDIIIKDIGVAVEYKLIREIKEVNIALEALIVDAKMYIDNSFNKNCIAVLCIKNSVLVSSIEIRREWRKLQFPKNWELVIIENINITS